MQTDPAKELVDTLTELTDHGAQKFSGILVRDAEVEVWSKEFFLIIFEILNRIDFIISEVRLLPLDDDLKEDALESIDAIRAVFRGEHLLKYTSQDIANTVSGANLTVLKMLSPQIRQKISYKALNREEIKELVSDVRQLLNWLHEVQSEEYDFLRQAMIEGLEAFVFRLERLKWFGRGVTLESLKEVLLAYVALEGLITRDTNGDELQKAILAKCGATLQRTLKVFDIAKETTDKAGWALQAYGDVSAVLDGSSTIVGLLN